MNKVRNFRLNDSTMTLLEELAEKKNKTKTAIIGEAIVIYYNVEKPRNKLLKYAGSLSKDTADKMREAISKSRTSSPIPKL